MNSYLNERVSEVISFFEYMNRRNFSQSQIQILKFVEKIVIFSIIIKSIIQSKNHNFRITFKNNNREKIKISTCYIKRASTITMSFAKLKSTIRIPFY